MTRFDISEIQEDAQAGTAAVLEHELLHSLAQQNPQGTNATVVFEARGADGQVAGGLVGSTSYGWFLIKILWVEDSASGKGLGSRLMARAEDKARRLGCHGAWLDTSDARAKLFYERRGYGTFGSLGNKPGQMLPEHKRWFMKKAL